MEEQVPVAIVTIVLDVQCAMALQENGNVFGMTTSIQTAIQLAPQPLKKPEIMYQKLITVIVNFNN